jgi:Fe-S cluster assembly iron-binding protein IscA
MLTLTEAARTHLAQVLDQTEAPSNMTIRFVLAEDNRLIVSLDYTRPGDTTFVHNGKVVLVLDAQAARALTQSTVDLLQRLNAEPQFVLRV